MTDSLRRAILYARVSSEEQVKGYSLRQQMEALKEYAAYEGYEVVKEVTDARYSGGSLARPGMDEVRDLVSHGRCLSSPGAGHGPLEPGGPRPRLSLGTGVR